MHDLLSDGSGDDTAHPDGHELFQAVMVVLQEKVFEKNSDDILNSMHPDLKKYLDVDDLLDGKSKFDELVNNINSDLYRFIETR